MTPPGIRRLLRRCLEKDPKRRLHDMADARIEIEDALANPASAAAGERPRSRRALQWLPWVLVAGLAASGGLWEATRSIPASDNPLANAQFKRARVELDGHLRVGHVE